MGPDMPANGTEDEVPPAEAVRATGGTALVAALVAHGVDTVFGLPGVQLYAFFDALARAQDAIRTIVSRHEQGAGYMAFGYARSTGRPGVFAVVPGPGVLNASAALATALACNEPVLCITSQVPTPFIGLGRGHVHELPDQLAILKGVTKWAARIERASDAPMLVAEAFRRMMSGRPGPVALEMPWDIMLSEESVALPPPVLRAAAAPAPNDAAVEAAAGMLVAAERPLVLVGRGAIDAGPAVLDLAEALGCPVASFRSGRGIVPEDQALGLDCAGAQQLWPETDLLLGIGTRLELPYMKWGSLMVPADASAGPPLIRVDIDPTEMDRLRPEVGIVADARSGVEALVQAVRRRGAPGRSLDRIREARERGRAVARSVQPQAAYLEAIRRAMPRNGILVEELSQVGLASYYAFPVYQPRTFLTSGYQANLGFGFQAALGAKVARPDRMVVALAGDGGLMFGVQELATAAQYGIGVIVVVFNNGAFGNVRRDQQALYEGRTLGADLHNPRFAEMATTFDVASARVGSPDELEEILVRENGRVGPFLVEVVVAAGSESSPWAPLKPVT